MIPSSCHSLGGAVGPIVCHSDTATFDLIQLKHRSLTLTLVNILKLAKSHQISLLSSICPLIINPFVYILKTGVLWPTSDTMVPRKSGSTGRARSWCRRTGSTTSRRETTCCTCPSRRTTAPRTRARGPLARSAASAAKARRSWAGAC